MLYFSSRSDPPLFFSFSIKKKWREKKISFRYKWVYNENKYICRALLLCFVRLLLHTHAHIHAASYFCRSFSTYISTYHLHANRYTCIWRALARSWLHIYIYVYGKVRERYDGPTPDAARKRGKKKTSTRWFFFHFARSPLLFYSLSLFCSFGVSRLYIAEDMPGGRNSSFCALQNRFSPRVIHRARTWPCTRGGMCI